MAACFLFHHAVYAAAKNGIYISLVKDVRDAFEGSELVKINCEGMHASDYKKLGAKLKVCVIVKIFCSSSIFFRISSYATSVGMYQ